MGRTTKLKSKTKISEAEDKTTFFYYAFRNILLVSIPLIIISALVLSLPHPSATTSSSDHVYFTLSTSCTMSGELISPHTVEIHGGQYKTNVGTTKLNTYCNDGNGYSIYAIGSSNNTDGNNYLINSENNNYNISTGIYDSGTATVNTPSSWSMKLASGTGSGGTLTPPTIINGYDDYSEIPNTYTQVAKRTSETEMNTNTDVTGSYLTTTYAIYTNSYQPAGSYSGNVKYVMMHPNSNLNTITNSFNVAFISAGKQPVYQDNDGNYYFAMQDMTSDICNSVTGNGETTATQLVDIRDNKLYWVAKLADDNCWMTQNLDLDIISDTNAQNYIALTSENTDLSTNESIYTDSNTIYALKGENDTYGYTYENGIATWIPERSTIAYNQLNSTTWQNSNTDPYSYDRLDTSTGQPVYPDSNITQAIAGDHGLSGNYYNYTASVASNDSTNVNAASPNPTNSICPKGWRLPNTTNNEFGNLLVAYGIIQNNTSTSYLNGGFAKMGATPLYFVRGESIVDSSLKYSNDFGFYLSNTFKNNSDSFLLGFYSVNIFPQDSHNRHYGSSLRCLAR